LAYAEITSNQTGITATGFAINDITGLTVTVPGGGTRPVYLKVQLHVTQDTAGAAINIGIYPSTANNALQSIGAAYITIPVATRFETITSEVRLPAGTSGTYKVSAQVTSGSATIVASSIAPSYLKAVEA
jgi:hypothetical protein